MGYESPTDTIKRVGIFLGSEMPNTQKQLIEHVIGLEACKFELAEQVTKWHKELAEYKNRMLHPKDKDLTELDRNTMLDANIAVVRKDYELLVKLEEIVKERIDLAKILLLLIK